METWVHFVNYNTNSSESAAVLNLLSSVQCANWSEILQSRGAQQSHEILWLRSWYRPQECGRIGGKRSTVRNHNNCYKIKWILVKFSMFVPRPVWLLVLLYTVLLTVRGTSKPSLTLKQHSLSRARTGMQGSTWWRHRWHMDKSESRRILADGELFQQLIGCFLKVGTHPEICNWKSLYLCFLKNC